MSDDSTPEKKQIRNSTAEFLIFSAQSGGEGLEVRYEDATIWLPQRLMAQLFDVSVPTINEHLKNIFSQGEVDSDSAIRKFRITAADGKNYDTKHYNLDAIISVGYRVNSYQATQFRIWATKTLKPRATRMCSVKRLTCLRATHRQGVSRRKFSSRIAFSANCEPSFIVQ